MIRIAVHDPSQVSEDAAKSPAWSIWTSPHWLNPGLFQVRPYQALLCGVE